MSTSESPLGECVVCGEVSSTRCGECSAHGTKFMFFCGPEHQRLVWFLHRKVCGRRSHPFTFPGLSEAEEKEFYELSRKKITYPPELEAFTWQDTFEEKYGILTPARRDQAFKRHIEAFRDGDIICDPEVQEKLIDFRKHAFTFRERLAQMELEELASTLGHDHRSDRPEDSGLTSKKHSIDFFAEIITQTGVEHLCYPNPPPFKSELYHRLLILCALMVLVVEDRRRGDRQLAREEQTVVIQLRNFLEKVVEPVRPDIARLLEPIINPDLLA
ncbi:hypothetical protein JCM5350_007264 [Sporobolomyces pararoseus]